MLRVVRSASMQEAWPLAAKAVYAHYRASARCSRVARLVGVTEAVVPGEDTRSFAVACAWPGSPRSLSSLLVEPGVPPLPLVAALRVWYRLLAALQAIHASGILHQGLQPHSVFLAGQDEPVLADLSLARVVRSTASVVKSLATLSMHADAIKEVPIYYVAPEVIEEGSGGPQVRA